MCARPIGGTTFGGFLSRTPSNRYSSADDPSPTAVPQRGIRILRSNVHISTCLPCVALVCNQFLKNTLHIHLCVCGCRCWDFRLRPWVSFLLKCCSESVNQWCFLFFCFDLSLSWWWLGSEIRFGFHTSNETLVVFPFWFGFPFGFVFDVVASMKTATADHSDNKNGPLRIVSESTSWMTGTTFCLSVL